MVAKTHPLRAAIVLAFGSVPIVNAQLPPLPAAPAGCNSTAPSCIGAFGAPFTEPKIGTVTTTEKCLPDAQGNLACKPTAGSLASLYDGRFLYFNAIEGTENIEFNIVLEGGNKTVNDQTRVLSFDAAGNPSWLKPTPIDGGGNADSQTPIVPGGLITGQSGADGSLFCADLATLADGRVLAVGGTDYYNEPGVDGLPVGVLEVEGLKNARIFNPKNNKWTQTGSMTYGRWYPTVLNLANSDVMVVSGVNKLVKPIYPEQPFQSGRNVVQSETYNAACGTWSDNGALGQRSLPLFSRIHLLPNGHALYNAGGQQFNPSGQGYDQALWNIIGTYNPAAKSWSDVGYAGFPLQMNSFGAAQLSQALNPTNPDAARILLDTLVGMTFTSPDALVGAVGAVLGYAVDRQVVEKTIGSGMRGSTFSVMLPLKPDTAGNYGFAQFLTAGGIPTAAVATSPGTYLPTDSSRIDSYDTTSGVQYTSHLTGKLNQPRWYGSGVLLPDASVMAFSGANRDEVASPGLGGALPTAERFDPATQTWKKMATATQLRTYHNTAVLMPDGRVLVAGHAPITTAYAFHTGNNPTLGLSPNDGRDPSFEIYSPPYVFRSDRPVITNATTTPVKLDRGQLHTVKTPGAASIDGVMLIRHTDTTHLVDADLRGVYVPIVARNSNSVTVRIPSSSAVLPAGHYMLFISKTAGDGTVVPSKSTPVRIAADARSCS